MQKLFVGEISPHNIKLLEEIISEIIKQNYVKGDAKTASKKIVQLFTSRAAFARPNKF
ncbi:MAG: hypothetical protein NTZ97_01195 [Candidatus Moranbacteria bacterium]|nr:hypothetical protein [Candidatus Moranbacteria bacterium]